MQVDTFVLHETLIKYSSALGQKTPVCTMSDRPGEPQYAPFEKGPDPVLRLELVAQAQPCTDMYGVDEEKMGMDVELDGEGMQMGIRNNQGRLPANCHRRPSATGGRGMVPRTCPAVKLGFTVLSQDATESTHAQATLPCNIHAHRAPQSRKLSTFSLAPATGHTGAHKLSGGRVQAEVLCSRFQPCPTDAEFLHTRCTLIVHQR